MGFLNQSWLHNSHDFICTVFQVWSKHQNKKPKANYVREVVKWSTNKNEQCPNRKNTLKIVKTLVHKLALSGGRDAWAEAEASQGRFAPVIPSVFLSLSLIYRLSISLASDFWLQLACGSRTWWVTRRAGGLRGDLVVNNWKEGSSLLKHASICIFFDTCHI